MTVRQRERRWELSYSCVRACTQGPGIPDQFPILSPRLATQEKARDGAMAASLQVVQDRADRDLPGR